MDDSRRRKKEVTEVENERTKWGGGNLFLQVPKLGLSFLSLPFSFYFFPSACLSCRYPGICPCSKVGSLLIILCPLLKFRKSSRSPPSFLSICLSTSKLLSKKWEKGNKRDSDLKTWKHLWKRRKKERRWRDNYSTLVFLIVDVFYATILVLK